MKKIFYTFMVAVCVMLLTACSSDDEPKWEDKYPDVDKQLVDNLKSANTSKYYCLTEDVKSFIKENDGDDWMEVDFIPGFESPSAHIYINEGKVMTSLHIWASSMGPYRAQMAQLWEVCKMFEGEDAKLYTFSVFEPDRDKMTVKIGTEEYKLDLLNENQMGITAESRRIMVKFLYETSEIPDEEKSKMLVFESRNAAYQYIIDTEREHFGDVIDLNKLYGRDVFDYPIIDLDELQRELDNNNIR